jgi:hypothetical protein
MGNGNSAGFQVSAQSLRSVARIWDQQAEAIAAIPGKTEGVRLNRLNAGIFQLIVSPYEAVLNAVADRSRQGDTQMRDIASELRASADTYDKTENSNAGIVRQAGNGRK